MKLKKVICIDNTGYNTIIIDRLYIAKPYNNYGFLCYIYDIDFNTPLGLFTFNLKQ